MIRTLGYGIAVALLAAHAVAHAERDLDTILEGFDDEPPRSETAGPPPPAGGAEDDFWDLSGELYVSASGAYAHDAPNAGEADYRGLAKLRVGSKLVLDLAEGPLAARASGRGFRDLVYPIKKRDEFTHEALANHEADLEVGELWLRATPTPGLDVQVGRQIVAWGRSETLRVVDVLNPIDNREPGVVDLADLRLPVAMTRLDYFRGQLGLTAIAIHESRTDKTPVTGSEFFPPGIPLLGVDRPSNGGSDTEWAVALSGRFQGWDASLHWARFYEDLPRLDPDTLRFTQSRITLLGATGNYAWGNWLLKGEVARNRGLRYFAVPRRRFARSDALVGVEYYGLRDASISLEVVARRLHGFEDALKRAPDLAEHNAFETALRYRGSFRNDTVRVTLLAVLIGELGHQGALYRASAERELRSGLIAEIGIAIYEGGDSTVLDAVDENDRVFFSVKQSF